MGLCNDKGDGGEKGDDVENGINKRIDNEMFKDSEIDSKLLKLLLLGAGESGKSTLFKALISIYGEGYPDHERMQYVEIVWNNTITAMQMLVENVDTYSNLESPEAEAAKTFLQKIQKSDIAKMDKNYISNSQDSHMSKTVAAHIKALWKDPGVQKTYEMRSQFQLFDSAAYFFNNIDNIALKNYLPSKEDVLRSRVRTTGIVESAFKIDGNEFRMYDVGGQRNERKKWIHCFEKVTAVIFVVAISAYDLVLFEDEQTNRMKEALTLFGEICNSKWFTNTSMILFLNKMDLFEEKIKRVSLNTCFPEYKGELGEVKVASEYIRDRFMEKNENTNKEIYPYFTTATDTDIVGAVFTTVKKIIIKRSLIDAGLC